MKAFAFGVPVTYNYIGERAQQYNKISVSAKYSSLKDELVHNTVANISIKLYEQQYAKATTRLSSDYCKSISPRFDACGLKWQISINHILSIMMYCNFEQFQYQFRKTYREDNGAKHHYFYHVGKYLKISVHKFGTSIRESNITLFYHGLSEEMSLDRYIGPIPIHIPLSTTPEIGSAANFVNNGQGMMIQFSESPYWNAKYLSVGWLANSSHESELLFVDTVLQISDITLCRSNLHYFCVIDVLNVIDGIFHNESYLRYEAVVRIRTSPGFIYRIIKHQLYPLLFNSLLLRDKYEVQMINTYLSNQFVVHINYSLLLSSPYSSLLRLLFHSNHSNHEWIRIAEITALFTNLQEIVLENIRLSTFIFKNIYNHIKKNEMSRISVIEIMKIKEYNNCSTIHLINEYIPKFYKLQWIVRFENDHLLLFKYSASNSRQRLRKRTIWSRGTNDRNTSPVVAVNKHQNIVKDKEVIADNEYHDDYAYKEAYIDGKTYILPKEYTNIGPVFSYGKNWPNDIKPKYRDLKEEVLKNRYAPITKKEWNGILRKCTKILQGNFTSKRKQKWLNVLQSKQIGLKHIVALKLYTDCDLLQREFRKSFRTNFNEKKERLQEFFHWRHTLRETFSKFSNILSALEWPEPNILFHGINSVMCIDEYKGTYYGPCSTTTDLHVARAFAGKNGMILVMKAKTARKVLDISWISDYPDEREYLLFDHEIDIESWILSSDYDQFYHYYHSVLTKGNIINGSYHSQIKDIEYLRRLKSLVNEVEIVSNHKDKNKNKVKIKQDVDFNKDVLGLDSEEKIDLLVWMLEFVLKYKYGKGQASKYDESLNANIQHAMKQIHTMIIPPHLVNNFIKRAKLTVKRDNKEMSDADIRSALDGYFINTKCPMDVVRKV